MSALTDQLTPYVLPIRHEVDAALRQLLGLGDATPLAWEARCADVRAGTGTLKALVGDAAKPVQVDMQVVARDGRPGLAMRRPRLQYRSLDELAGSADFRLYRRIAGQLDKARSEAVERTARAVARWWRHQDVGDWMYRQISAPDVPCATIRLGFRCNQRCSFCWQGRHWPEPPSELYARWVDETAALGVTSITFSGGEPTLHPDLPALVARAASKVPTVGVAVQTNAVRLSDVAYLHRLIEAGLQIALVSYHSADPAVSDAMTGARGSHARTVDGILACLRHGRFGKPEVRLNCLVERANVAGLEEHARDVVRRFVTPFPDNPVRVVEYSYPNQAFDQEYWRRSVAPLDEVRGPLAAAARLLRSAGAQVSLFSGCGFPACALADAPELIRPVALDTLDAKDTEGRVYGAACDGCALRRGCLGLRHEYVQVHGERGLAPLAAWPGDGPP